MLRAGLWSRDPECECFPLSREVWEEIYVIARKQTVEGIIYDGMMKLPANYLPPKELLLKWVVAINSIEGKNRRMNKVVGELHKIFTKNHIAAFLMKGQGVAALYDNPLHRICGDIDWAFPDKNNFDRAEQLLKKNKVKIEKHVRSELFYVWKGFIVEHHRELVNIDNPFLSKYLLHIQRQEQVRTVYVDADGQKIPLPSPMLTHLSVNAHILKHLLSFGIAIRQLCDSARTCCMYHQEIEGERLKETYCKLGIYRWIQLLNRLLVDYLGMPEEYLPFPLVYRQKADFMMQDILRGGSFGFYGDAVSMKKDGMGAFIKYVLIRRPLRIIRYICYAPGEAFWSPVMEGCSHIFGLISAKLGRSQRD